MFTAIVTTASAIAGGFIALFWLRPDFRKWVEAPKYRFLAQERRFDAASKDGEA